MKKSKSIYHEAMRRVRRERWAALRDAARDLFDIYFPKADT